MRKKIREQGPCVECGKHEPIVYRDEMGLGLCRRCRDLMWEERRQERTNRSARPISRDFRDDA